MVSLTLAPNALIGLTERLKIPKNFQVKSGARPSLFAYPEPLQPPKKEEQAKTATAVLSTAAKAKALREKKAAEEMKSKEAKKEKADADVDMDDKTSVANSTADGAFTRSGDNASVAATPGTTVVGSLATESVAASDLGSDTAMVAGDEESAAAPKEAVPKAGEDKPAEGETSGKSVSADASKAAEGGEGEAAGAEEKAASKEPPEPTEEILNNPCRVLKGQIQYISFPKEVDGNAVRYTPLLEKRHVGFLLLQDTKPEEPEDLFLEEDKSADAGDEKEPDPPEPFEWTDN